MAPEQEMSTFPANTGGDPEKAAPGDDTMRSTLPYVTGNDASFKQKVGKEDKIVNNPTLRKGYLAAAFTMCLGVMGGAILPVPSAFQVTGILAAIIISIVVCAANVYTADLLLRQCYKSGARDYEEIAFAAGGKIWLVLTQASLVVLLGGSIIGGFQQTAEAFVFGCQSIWGDSVPEWVLYKNSAGDLPMVVLTFAISFPLCLVKQLRSLEYAGMAGFLVVMWLTIDVWVQSIGNGLPKAGTSEFPVSGFNSLDNIATSLSILGFAFYIQPIMMPLLAEMPGAPRHQARVLSWAMRFTLVIFAAGVYISIGFFGAARFGANTQGNILQNTLLGGGKAQGVLNFAMCFYISLSVPPLEYPMRMILNNWLPGDHRHHPWLRHVGITLFELCACLAIAIFYQSGSAKLLTITGATGVVMAAYICPIGNHFLLYYGKAKCQQEASQHYRAELERSEHSHYGGHPLPKFLDSQSVPVEQALPPVGPNSLAVVGPPSVLTYRREVGPGAWDRAYEVLSEVVLPILVVIFGAFVSVASLYATFK